MTTANSDALQGNVGRPLVFWPGWTQFASRLSPQTDVNPLPIEITRAPIWEFVQPQLSNGWQQTNYGLRASYDDYLRMITASNSGPNYPHGRPPTPLPGQGLAPTGYPSPSDIQLANGISRNAPPTTTNLNGGTGLLAPGVNLSGRGYYG